MKSCAFGAREFCTLLAETMLPGVFLEPICEEKPLVFYTYEVSPLVKTKTDSNTKHF